MIQDWVMNPGDRFVATECGCAMVVDTGPQDINNVTQAPKCCCGHDMVKQGNTDRLLMDEVPVGAASGQVAVA